MAYYAPAPSQALTGRSSSTKLLQVGCTLTYIWQAPRLVLPAVALSLGQHAQGLIASNGGNPEPLQGVISNAKVCTHEWFLVANGMGVNSPIIGRSLLLIILNIHDRCPVLSTVTLCSIPRSSRCAATSR